MVDIPERTDDASGIIIYGVESEQIEEENDAYNDMRAELGDDVKCWCEMQYEVSLRNKQRWRGRARGADAVLFLPQYVGLHYHETLSFNKTTQRMNEHVITLNKEN